MEKIFKKQLIIKILLLSVVIIMTKIAMSPIQKQYEPNFEEDDIEEKSESEIELLKVLRSIR